MIFSSYQSSSIGKFHYPKVFVESLNAKDNALIQLGYTLKEHGYRFITVSPATHARVNGRIGNENAIDMAGVFGWTRPFRSSILPKEVFDLMHRAGVIEPHNAGWISQVRVSTLEDQLFFHSAYPTLNEDAVFFGPDTYRFAAAINRHCQALHASPCRIADIGCGAGVGAILAGRYFSNADVAAIDINEAALRLTRINSVLAGTANVTPGYGNLLKNSEDNFDFILSNPPYLVDAAQRTYRHGGGSLGAALSLDIIDTALNRLNPGGSLLLYTGTAIVNGVDAFRQKAERKLGSAGVQWCYGEIDPDVFSEELSAAPYLDADRIAAVVLTVTKTLNH